MASTELTRTIDAVWRIESARIVAAVARIVRDVGLAEELAQDALVAALEHWAAEGQPKNPAAWLMTTARNKALDRIRQAALHRRKQEELGPISMRWANMLRPTSAMQRMRTSTTTCCG